MRRKLRRSKQRPTRKAPHIKASSKSYRRKRIKRYRSDKPGICVVCNGTITWTLPRKLRSLNKIRTGLSRYGDTKGWERQFLAAETKSTDLSLGPDSNQRLKLEILRLAPRKDFFLDKVNLYGGAKGLEDALVRLRYLVDDNEAWEDGPYVTQDVSPDGKYWTIIKLSEIVEETPKVRPIFLT